MKEEEEAAMLAEFLDPANAAGLPWEKREGAISMRYFALQIFEVRLGTDTFVCTLSKEQPEAGW